MSADIGRGLHNAIAAGMSARDAWVKSVELIEARTLALHWLVSSRHLAIAAREHELVAVFHRRRKYFPCEFLLIGPAVVAQVSKELAALPPWCQVVFRKRGHGALGGQTVSAFLTDEAEGESRTARVLALAQAWAAEEKRS